MTRYTLPLAAFFAMCFLLVASLLQAQSGGMLSYGAAVVGRLDGASASIIYTFEGAAGDIAHARLLGMAAGLRPALTLISPSQQEVAASGSAEGVPDAEIVAVLPESGTYGILVSGGNGGGGEFLLQLARRDFPADAPRLAFDEPFIATLSGAAGPERFIIEPAADCPLALSVQRNSPGDAGFSGRLLDAGGHVLASFSAQHNVLTLPAGTGSLVLELTSATSGAQTSAVVLPHCAGESLSLPAPEDSPADSALSGMPATGFMMVRDGGSISYGQGILGQMLPGAPLLSYSFTGQAGDIIRADLAAFTPGLDPVLYLISPEGQPLAYSDNLPFGLTPGDAGLSFALPESGTYALVVGQVNGASGSYVLRLAGGPLAPAVPIPAEVPIPIDENAFLGAPRVSYLLAARDCPATVVMSAADSAGVPVDVRLLNPAGAVVGDITGTIMGWQTALSANSGVYRFEARPVGSGAGYTLLVSCADAASSPVLAATAQPETTAGDDSATVCMLSAPNNINIRSGPGTQYTVLGVMLAGSSREAIGVSADRSWYVVPEDGILGLVSAGIVTTQGPCDALPVNDGYLGTQRVAPTPVPATSIPLPTGAPAGNQPPAQNPNPGNQPPPQPTTGGPQPTIGAPPTVQPTPEPQPTDTPSFATPEPEPTFDCGPVACVAAPAEAG